MAIKDAQRFVWFSTKDKTIFGRAFRKEPEKRSLLQKILKRKYEAGTYYQMEKVSFVQAVEAFETFLSSPGNFSVETLGRCRIDFLYKKGATELFLDTWHSEETIEDAVISTSDAKKLLEVIFRNDSDKAIAEFISSRKVVA
jgi:hypothetical protein